MMRFVLWGPTEYPARPAPCAGRAGSCSAALLGERLRRDRVAGRPHGADGRGALGDGGGAVGPELLGVRARPGTLTEEGVRRVAVDRRVDVVGLHDVAEALPHPDVAVVLLAVGRVELLDRGGLLVV